MSLPEPASRDDLLNFARQLGERFDKVDKRFDQVDKRFEQVDKKFEQVDKKLDQVDKRFEQMTEFIRGIETNLLTEFHRYAKAQTSRLHMLETVNSDFLTRMALIEERLLELEGRIRPPRQ